MDHGTYLLKSEKSSSGHCYMYIAVCLANFLLTNRDVLTAIFFLQKFAVY